MASSAAASSVASLIFKNPENLNSNKGNRNCCVYGCNSLARRNRNLMFHSFPKPGEKVLIEDEFGGKEICDRRKVWENRLKMGKKSSNSMRVCSLHFKEEDYIRSGWSSRSQLSKTAVPSKNLPGKGMIYNIERKERNKKARQERREKRALERNAVLACQQDVITADCVCNSYEEDEKEVAEILVNLQDNHDSVATVPKTFCDQSVQVNLCCDSECKQLNDAYKQLNDVSVQVDTLETVTVSDFVKSDKQLSSLTGLHSLALLNTIVYLMKTFVKEKRVHRLSAYKRVFLVFMKMKLDLPYVVLAVLFGVSSQTCKNIFKETIVILSEILKSVVYFPSVEEVRQNMPKCFKDFMKVRVVLDCTEVPVQRHKRLCCRIKCYSHYKGTTTIKFMTGTSPAGLITYVSPPYGGRVSDRAIFERSGLLELLEPFSDQIMVDKGYLIDEICECFGITLVRPPFLKNKKKFSASEALINAKIASARVHIERANQRIKVFRILSNCLPVNLIPVIENIFFVICAVVNLSAPILADDKFI